jgi:hypothetical protein
LVDQDRGCGAAQVLGDGRQYPFLGQVQEQRQVVLAARGLAAAVEEGGGQEGGHHIDEPAVALGVAAVEAGNGVVQGDLHQAVHLGAGEALEGHPVAEAGHRAEAAAAPGHLAHVLDHALDAHLFVGGVDRQPQGGPFRQALVGEKAQATLVEIDTDA